MIAISDTIHGDHTMLEAAGVAIDYKWLASTLLPRLNPPSSVLSDESDYI